MLISKEPSLLDGLFKIKRLNPFDANEMFAVPFVKSLWRFNDNLGQRNDRTVLVNLELVIPYNLRDDPSNTCIALSNDINPDSVARAKISESFHIKLTAPGTYEAIFLRIVPFSVRAFSK